MRRNTLGFTLTELMIVVAIAGILLFVCRAYLRVRDIRNQPVVIHTPEVVQQKPSAIVLAECRLEDSETETETFENLRNACRTDNGWVILTKADGTIVFRESIKCCVICGTGAPSDCGQSCQIILRTLRHGPR